MNMFYLGIILLTSILSACVSVSKDEYINSARNLCQCMAEKDSIDSKDTLRKIDLKQINYVNCLRKLALDPFSEEIKRAIHSECPSLDSYHRE